MTNHSKQAKESSQKPNELAQLEGGDLGRIDAELRAMKSDLESGATLAREMDKSHDSPSSEQADMALGKRGYIRDYQLLTKLGEGGMGTVYKALHTRLKRPVALKALRRDKTCNGETLARFDREMQAIGKLQHPNIVAALDAGEAEGQHFLVMELVDGQDLSQILQQHGPLKAADACELVRQAAVGLQEAHEHHMVHRDIKPSNLMLTLTKQKKESTATVKILDMGLALLAGESQPHGELTTDGQLMGTVDYMAPEQAADTHKVDIRADIYSLGATLLKLLTGEFLYQGSQYNTSVKKILALVHEPAPTIRNRCPGVPPALIDLLERLLSKQKEDRPATPEKVAAALAPFANGHNIAALLADTPATTADTAAVGSDQVDTKPFVAADQKAPSSGPMGHTGETVDVPQPASRLSTVWKWPVAVLFLLTTVPLAAAGVFFLRTPDGATVRVEVNDPQLEVTFKEQDIHVRGLREKLKVSAGRQTLLIQHGGFSFQTKKLVLKEGQKTTLKIELLPTRIRVIKDGQVIDEEPFKPATAPTSETPPAKNYALQFNGQKDRVHLYGDTELKIPEQAPVTVECIVTPASLKPGQVLALRHIGLELVQNRKEDNFYWRAQILLAAGKMNVTSGQPVSAKRPYHIAFFTHKNTLRMWIDGREVKGGFSSKNLDPQADGLNFEPRKVNLSMGIGGWTSYFHGTVDELRISSTARHTESYKPLSRLSSDKQTIALYHFDAGKGATLKDYSGNGYDGTIRGAKWVIAP